MKHHFWKTATCTLALSVSLLGLAWTAGATKRKAPQTPTTDTLTVPERFCVNWGTLTFVSAQARDRGVSYLTLVAIMRQTITGERLRRGLATLRLLYEMPHITPALARQQVELECTQHLEGHTHAP